MIADLNLLRQESIFIDQPVKKVRVPAQVADHQSQIEELDPVFQGVVQQYGFSIVDTEVSSYTSLLLQDVMPVVNHQPKVVAGSALTEGSTYFATDDLESSQLGLSITDEEVASYTAQLLG